MLRAGRKGTVPDGGIPKPTMCHWNKGRAGGILGA